MRTLNLQTYTLPENEYLRRRIDNGLIYDYSESWDIHRPYYNTAITALGIDPLAVNVQNKDDSALLYQDGELLVLIDFGRRKLTANISAKSREEISAYIEKLQKIYPPSPDVLEDKIKVNFWYLTNAGLRNISRKIAVPKWDTIQGNYHPNTLKGLKFLMQEFKPSTGGQLVIWQGLPGTGKSYALRSLLYEWRDWCTAEYVLDPESLFSNSSYLAELILRKAEDEFDPDDPVEAFEETDTDSKWKVFILEDSGEMLSADAKERTGQGLSRLLNLVDGFIGQGLKILVLITTNEDFGKLHPAVSREGRCAAAIKFKALSYDQAVAWSGSKLDEIKEYTLAELFALQKDIETPAYQPDMKQIGFQLRGN